MTRPVAVFRSVSQALHVAFMMEFLPVTQKSNTQVVIQRLLEDAGIPHRDAIDGAVNFSGLNPMEVRGECSVTRAAVKHHCAPLEAHAIHAWFGDPNSADKIAGVHAMRDHAASLSLFTFDDPMARLLVCWNIHSRESIRDRVTEKEIGAKAGVSQPTAHRNLAAVAKMCARLRNAGMDRLRPMWERDGKIESEISETA